MSAEHSSCVLDKNSHPELTANTEFPKALFVTVIHLVHITSRQVISSFGIDHAQYADDTQLNVALKDGSLSALKQCIQALHHWLDCNGLCLNPKRTDYAALCGCTSLQHGSVNEQNATMENKIVSVREITISIRFNFEQKSRFSISNRTS